MWTFIVSLTLLSPISDGPKTIEVQFEFQNELRCIDERRIAIKTLQENQDAGRIIEWGIDGPCRLTEET